MSTIVCDICEKYIHDRDEPKVIFEESIGFKRQDDEYEEGFHYCLDCFEMHFSVKRFAKLAAKHVLANDCCICDFKLNTKKQKHYAIKCYSSKIFLQCFYCEECYKKDIG